MTFDPWNRLSLLPHRLVGFSDGPSETFTPDEGGEGQGGVSEEAAERAAEERRQSAKAAKKQRKQEKKMKKRDDRLADIIREFINGAHRDDKMALLLSRLLQRNTPAGILLAVMSLTNQEVLEVLEDYLKDEQDIIPDEGPPQAPAAENQSLVEYGKELSLALSEWTRRIFLHASFHPMKSILALAHHHGVDHNMIQLTAFVIRDFFQNSGQEVPYDNIREFSELFWRDALKRLHQLADERGLLPDPTQDLTDEEDDDDDDDDDE